MKSSSGMQQQQRQYDVIFPSKTCASFFKSNIRPSRTSTKAPSATSSSVFASSSQCFRHVGSLLFSPAPDVQAPELDTDSKCPNPTESILMALRCYFSMPQARIGLSGGSWSLVAGLKHFQKKVK